MSEASTTPSDASAPVSDASTTPTEESQAVAIPDEEGMPTDLIEQPAKVLRIGSMVKQLLE
jgi:hypothetical protein